MLARQAEKQAIRPGIVVLSLILSSGTIYLIYGGRSVTNRNALDVFFNALFFGLFYYLVIVVVHAYWLKKKGKKDKK